MQKFSKRPYIFRITFYTHWIKFIPTQNKNVTLFYIILFFKHPVYAQACLSQHEVKEQFMTNILRFLQLLQPRKWQGFGVFKIFMQFQKRSNKSNILETVRVTGHSSLSYDKFCGYVAYQLFIDIMIPIYNKNIFCRSKILT